MYGMTILVDGPMPVHMGVKSMWFLPTVRWYRRQEALSFYAFAPGREDYIDA
jgi:hypothetical protein